MNAFQSAQKFSDEKMTYIPLDLSIWHSSIYAQTQYHRHRSSFRPYLGRSIKNRGTSTRSAEPLHADLLERVSASAIISHISPLSHSQPSISHVNQAIQPDTSVRAWQTFHRAMRASRKTTADALTYSGKPEPASRCPYLNLQHRHAARNLQLPYRALFPLSPFCKSPVARAHSIAGTAMT